MGSSPKMWLNISVRYMKKLLFLFFFAVIALPLSAQWSVGLHGGMDINTMARSSFYTSQTFEDRAGFSAGLSSEYMFNEWLGLRFGADILRKNYRTVYNNSVMLQSGCNEDFKNTYLQIPVMADFCIGSAKWRLHFLGGVYGGYWLSSRESGTINQVGLDPDDDSVIHTISFENEKVEFNATRDNRLCFGAVGGISIERTLSERWSLNVEALYCYDLSSQTKDYMSFKDPRYNNTVDCHFGISYKF